MKYVNIKWGKKNENKWTQNGRKWWLLSTYTVVMWFLSSFKLPLSSSNSHLILFDFCMSSVYKCAWGCLCVIVLHLLLSLIWHLANDNEHRFSSVCWDAFFCLFVCLLYDWNAKGNMECFMYVNKSHVSLFWDTISDKDEDNINNVAFFFIRSLEQSHGESVGIVWIWDLRFEWKQSISERMKMVRIWRKDKRVSSLRIVFFVFAI